jgi:hypothetical protein
MNLLRALGLFGAIGLGSLVSGCSGEPNTSSLRGASVMNLCIHPVEEDYSSPVSEGLVFPEIEAFLLEAERIELSRSGMRSLLIEMCNEQVKSPESNYLGVPEFDEGYLVKLLNWLNKASRPDLVGRLGL